MSVTEANTSVSPDGGVTSFEVNGLEGTNGTFRLGDGDVSGMYSLGLYYYAYNYTDEGPKSNSLYAICYMQYAK
jgi:hypothetical protein